MDGPEIIVRGLPEEQTELMVAVIEVVVDAVREQPLDLAHLDQVIVTDDYDAEQARISKETGKPVSYTNEDYARGIAQVLKIQGHDGSFGMILVMDLEVAGGLIGEDEQARSRATHFFHHELCHVHDDNQHRRCLPDYFLTHIYEGADQVFGPLAETVWSEYFANRYSCGTATNEVVSLYANGLADNLALVEELVEEAVVNYQCRSHDLDTLIETAKRHIHALLRLAAYMQGYIAGCNTTLKEFSPDLHRVIQDSYFWETWRRMGDETEKMHVTYPNWSSPAIYDGLKAVVADFFAQMGIIISELDDKTFHADVPVDLERIERVTARIAD